MSQRLKDLNERLANMQAFKANELALPKEQQSANYIADLNESMKSCKVQISHIQKHGEKIEVINWGEFV